MSSQAEISYPERIAQVLAKAPSPPPLQRKSAFVERRLRDETKAWLILVHAEAATFNFGSDRKKPVLM